MAYNAHNFQPGHKLTDTELNEMDNQIAASEQRLDEHQDVIDTLEDRLRTRLSELKNESDEVNIYFYDGDELLSEIPLSSLPASIIPCTALEVSTQEIEGYVGGGNTTISYSKQPNNCNQDARFMVADPSVATISNAGVVTPVSSGATHVTIQCGSHSSQIPVNIGQRVNPASSSVHLASRAMAIIANQRMNIDAAGTNDLTYLTVFIDSQITIPNGFSVKVVPKNRKLRIIAFTLITPINGGFTYTGESAAAENVGVNWMRVNNCDFNLHSKSIGEPSSGAVYVSGFSAGESATLVNSNTDDAYLVLQLEVADVSGTIVTPRQATTSDLSMIASEVDIIISPPNM